MLRCNRYAAVPSGGMRST